MPSTHGSPAEGMECPVTYEDITSSNYVEYTVSDDPGVWHVCPFEQMAVEQLVNTQFDKWIERVNKTDCQAELKRLLSKGPPIYVSDKVGFEKARNKDEGLDGNGEGRFVEKLWYMADGSERSGKLANALEGEKRDKKWTELKTFHGFEEADRPGDEEEKGGEEEKDGGRK